MVLYSAEASDSGTSNLTMRTVLQSGGIGAFNEIPGSQIFASLQSASSTQLAARQAMVVINANDVVKVQFAGSTSGVNIHPGDIGTISTFPTSIAFTITKIV